MRTVPSPTVRLRQTGVLVQDIRHRGPTFLKIKKLREIEKRVVSPLIHLTLGSKIDLPFTTLSRRGPVICETL